MLVEAAATALLLIARRDAWTMTGAFLLAVIWASTAFLQVPMHNVLTDGFNAEAHGRLVQTNWIRTIGWTLRGLLALYLVRTTD
jgi:multisubunit Na+/H+ antiporter MnhB subunit